MSIGIRFILDSFQKYRHPISDIVQRILHWLDWSNTSIPVCCSIAVIVDKLILQWSIDVNLVMYHTNNN